MSNSFRVATIGEIQIFINWTWLFAVAFLTWSLGVYYHDTFGWAAGTAYALGAISAVLLFVTVLLHELGHSFTARALGLPVNTIYLFIFGGVSNLTQEPTSPRMEFLITIAGPLTSLVLAGIFYALYLALHSASMELLAVLGYLASVNVLLALFNLIPAFPLDGGRVLRSIIWGITGSMRRATRIASRVGEVFAWLFILAGLADAFIAGQVLSGIWLAFIGWFLHNAASGSYQQAVMDQVLRGVDVADVMDRVPASVPPTTMVDALVFHHMLNANQRAVPVLGPDGRLLGLVTLSDIRNLSQSEWNTTPVSQIMTPMAQLRTVAPGEDLRHAMQVLAENNYHQLPVLEGDRLVGMLNRGHVLQYLHLRQMMAQRGGTPPAAGAGTSTSPHQRAG